VCLEGAVLHMGSDRAVLLPQIDEGSSLGPALCSQGRSPFRVAGAAERSPQARYRFRLRERSRALSGWRPLRTNGSSTASASARARLPQQPCSRPCRRRRAVVTVGGRLTQIPSQRSRRPWRQATSMRSSSRRSPTRVSQWLRPDLPHRVEALGLPATVVRQAVRAHRHGRSLTATPTPPVASRWARTRAVSGGGWAGGGEVGRIRPDSRHRRNCPALVLRWNTRDATVAGNRPGATKRTKPPTSPTRAGGDQPASSQTRSDRGPTTYLGGCAVRGSNAASRSPISVSASRALDW
jgi:hypothetical protein